MQPLFTPFFIAECFAFICSLLLFAKGIERRLLVYSFYCFAVVVNETLSVIVINNWHEETNHLLNNFAILFFFSFYIYTCRKEVEQPVKKKLIIVLLIIFLLSWLVEVLINTIYHLVDYALIIGCFCVAVAALSYMIELLSNHEIINPFTQMFFYIASGYMIYTIPLGIIFALHNYFAWNKTSVEADFREVFSIIMNVVNILLYLLLSISFIITWRQRKLSR